MKKVLLDVPFLLTSIDVVGGYKSESLLSRKRQEEIRVKELPLAKAWSLM
jgi:hypothetical protein